MSLLLFYLSCSVYFAKLIPSAPDPFISVAQAPVAVRMAKEAVSRGMEVRCDS